jgi:hypothetical protein
MSVFPKTRAAAGYIAAAGPGELARARAAILIARLDACHDILSGDGDGPAVLSGLLRDLVLAVRDLAGPAWLDASSDDPDVTAFTVLQAASPPDPARTDEICARVLWARFAPPVGQDDPGPDPPASQSPARPLAARDKDTEASTTHPSTHGTAVPGAAHPGQTDGPAGTGLT